VISWSRSLIDAYCSSWTIIQTLEWLNNVDARWMTGGRVWRLSLARGTVRFSEEEPSGDRPPDESEQLLDVHCALGEGCRWLRDEVLRYCPACIKIGRHYQYQQDDRFVRCILHRVPLKTGCPGCGAALDTKGSQVHSFACGSCGKALLNCAVPGVMSARQGALHARALDHVHRWLKAANDLLVGCQGACSGSTAICWDGDRADSNAGAYWYALIQLPDSIVQDALAPIAASFKQFPMTPLVLPLPMDDHRAAIGPYRYLLRCIARQIRRTYLRGHSGCRIHAMRSLGVGPPRRDSWAPVTLKPHLCCVAQAYAVWLLQRRAELEDIVQCMKINEFSHSVTPVLLPSLSAAALSYVSSFEAWVANLARLRSLVARTNRQPMLCDPFSYAPHWALHQPGTNWSCPTHLRFVGRKDRDLCDKGRVRMEDFELLMALGRHRHRMLAKLHREPRRRWSTRIDIPL
jgi:hypothetical protein